jgi:hypothetical protein
LVAERTKNDLVSNAASRIAVLVADDEGAVEVSFLAVLNRMPSENEKTVYVEHLAGKTGGQRVQALSDIFWAMINSTEFSWNH